MFILSDTRLLSCVMFFGLLWLLDYGMWLFVLVATSISLMVQFKMINNIYAYFRTTMKWHGLSKWENYYFTLPLIDLSMLSYLIDRGLWVFSNQSCSTGHAAATDWQSATLATIPDKHLRSPSSCSLGISPLNSRLDDGCRTCTATNPIAGTSSDRNHRRDRRRHCVEIFSPQLFGTNSGRPATQSPLPSPMSPPPT